MTWRIRGVLAQAGERSLLPWSIGCTASIGTARGAVVLVADAAVANIETSDPIASVPTAPVPRRRWW